MPGKRVSRQSTAREAKPISNSKRRSLDALAFAEEEIPIEARVRKNRVRDLAEATPARQQTTFSAASESEEVEPRPKRQKTLHKSPRPSDSEDDEVGNDMGVRVGAVDSDDDSSLNSDEAFDDGDQEAFKDFKFGRGSAVIPVTPNDVTEVPALKAGTVHSTLRERQASYGYRNVERPSGASGDPEDGENRQGPSEAIGFADDIEAPPSQESDDQDDSVLSMSDTDDGAADLQTLAKLKALATAVGKEREPDTSAPSLTDTAQEAATPSEYGISLRQKLSVADLLPTVADPQARKALRMMTDDGRRSKGSAIGVPGRLDVPLPKRKQDRLDRAAAYEKSKETLSRWIETVKRNRRAEHLSFPLPDADESSSKNVNRLPPTSASNPITDLESAIKSILSESGMATATRTSQDSQIQQAEQLAANKLPLEEIQAKRAELRRNRDLLFREEIRAKRIKKIKSKAYRRVHRKERDRNLLREREALAPAGDVAEEEESLHRIRAEERMSGRHRESKWAKSMKEVGRQAWDGEARGDLTEMAQRNEELRRRIQGTDAQDEGASSESDTAQEISSDGEQSQRHSRNLVKKLDQLGDSNSMNETSRLGSLKFMQKANAMQRTRNNDETEEIRQDLTGKVTAEDNAAEMQTTGRRRYGPKQLEEQATVRRTAPVNDFEEGQNSDAELDEVEETVQIVTEDPSPTGQAKINATEPLRGRSKRTGPSKGISDSGGNPWLSQPSNRKTHGPTAMEGSVVIHNTLDSEHGFSTAGDGSQSVLKEPQPATPLDTAALKPTGQSPEPLIEHSDNDTESSFSGFSSPGSPRDPNFSGLRTNHELIRRAFASDDVLATSDFAAEKAALAQDDQDDQGDAGAGSGSTLPGWGCWTGAGLPKRDRKKPTGTSVTKTARLPQQVTGEQATNERPRQDRGMANVMISQKRMPKTARFLATALPQPFETRAQYERSLRLPVGREWLAGETFREMVRPRVEIKAGEVVHAMSQPTV